MPNRDFASRVARFRLHAPRTRVLRLELATIRGYQVLPGMATVDEVV